MPSGITDWTIQDHESGKYFYLTSPLFTYQCEVSFFLVKHWQPVVVSMPLAPVADTPVSCVA
jgi:hypothetical protein